MNSASINLMLAISFLITVSESTPCTCIDTYLRKCPLFPSVKVDMEVRTSVLCMIVGWNAARSREDETREDEGERGRRRWWHENAAEEERQAGWWENRGSYFGRVDGRQCTARSVSMRVTELSLYSAQQGRKGLSVATPFTQLSFDRLDVAIQRFLSLPAEETRRKPRELCTTELESRTSNIDFVTRKMTHSVALLRRFSPKCVKGTTLNGWNNNSTKSSRKLEFITKNLLAMQKRNNKIDYYFINMYRKLSFFNRRILYMINVRWFYNIVKHYFVLIRITKFTSN